MFGLGPNLPPTGLMDDGADGIEKRAELALGDRCSTDEREVVERTEKRGCG